jgi:N-acylglucosamine-6-phosphate 2-epimerase
MTAPLVATVHDALTALRGGVVVSCQAPPDDPLSGPDAMRRVARAVVQGGAAGIRAEGIDDLTAIRADVEVPLIGLWKDGDAPVYITPTAEHAVAVARTGAQLVAVDATDRPRPDGRELEATIAAVHDAGAGVLADVATVEEGLRAEALGVDAVATTLSGYTTGVEPTGPDLALVEALAGVLQLPLLAEGRYRSAEQVAAAFDRGAWSVVVGTAITRPQLLTRDLVDTVTARRRARQG